MIKTYKNIKTIFYLEKRIFPENFNFKKFKLIIDKYKIYKKIICLPDLDFKVKNFVPSGVVIPTKNYFSPELLGPNNDSMLAIKFTLDTNNISKKSLDKIFHNIRQKITLFRRSNFKITRKEALNILSRGSKGAPKSWKINIKNFKNIYKRGVEKDFKDSSKIINILPKEKPNNLPEFVKSKNVIDAARKCVGVLDGTSHFIDLYKVDEIFNKRLSSNKKLKKNQFFFLVHAGSGDVGLILHHENLKNKNKILNLKSSLGKKAYSLNQISGNFGYINRLFIYKELSKILKSTFRNKVKNISIFSDLPHDYLDFIKNKKLFIHRKGAIRFNNNIPYLFPSCPGGDSYVMVSTNNKKNYNCVSHGAGRIISKKNSLIYFKNKNFIKKINNKTIFYRYNKDKIHGHHPNAFKNLKLIINIIKKYNLAKPIAKCKMIASLKA